MKFKIIIDVVCVDMEAYVKLNGSYTSTGNYIWGAALTLAWKRLIKDIIKEPIKIQSKKADALEITANFNKSPITEDIIDSQCFYAMSGFGNQTVKKINSQVSKKFPQKTTEKIPEDLPSDGIISYAYFLKNLKFDEHFKSSDVQFNNQLVPGFQAKNPKQKKQVVVHKYTNDDDFIIQLKTKSEKDHIFLIKIKKKHQAEDIIQTINKLKQPEGTLGSTDFFRMPKISIKHKRGVNELSLIKLANKNFQKYFFSQIYEIINLDIDETGVKVQNQGVMKLTKSKKPKTQERHFYLDKPFWIVMKEKNNHPYFVAFINNLN